MIGGKHDFVDWAGITGPDARTCILPQAADKTVAGRCPFYTNPQVIDTFKVYIAHLLNFVNPGTGVALKDDPQILAWETGNELVGCPSSWTKNVSDYIKVGLGAKQLVMDGRDQVWMGLDPQ